MLAGRRTSTEYILTFFEGENIVSPPQNRRVCDGLVTGSLHPIDLAQCYGRKHGRRCSRGCFFGEAAKLGGPLPNGHSTCRLSGSRWRHPAAATVRQSPFLKTLFADSAIRAATPWRLQISCPASGADHKTRSFSASRAASSCRDSNLNSSSSCQRPALSFESTQLPTYSRLHYCV